MTDFLYCMSNPDIPGIIRIGSAECDPRKSLHSRTSGPRSQRVEWVVRVVDAEMSEVALSKALGRYADQSWPGHYRCDPMRARAAAIEFTGLRSSEDPQNGEMPVVILPAAVLSLGLAVHLLGITNGHSGPSVALIAAALYWVVHATPLGSRDELRLA